MSVELGPTGGYVYVTEDGLNGKTLEALVMTMHQLAQSGSNIPGMSAALHEVIAYADQGQDAAARLTEAGRFLMGVNDSHVKVGDKLIPGDNVNVPFDGLLYAEGEDKKENGAFSVVRMGLWVRKSRKDEAWRTDSSELGDFLRDSALSPVGEDEEPWGIPVDRSTRIGSLLMPEDEGMTYGHSQDIEAVEALALPDDPLKQMMKNLVTLWHTVGNSVILEGKLAEVRAALGVR